MGYEALKVVYKTALTCTAVLTLDFFIYGELFPLLGLYLGSYLGVHYNLSYLAELCAVAGFSLLIFFISLALRVEKIFWRKLYTLDDFYRFVLHVRDFFNAVSVAVFVASLVTTSFNASVLASARGRDETNPAHPFEAFVPVICSRVEFYTRMHFKWCDDDYQDPIPSYEAVFEAKVLYAVAFICISVSKMLYFNTLFTYLQTLKMFREMQAMRQQQLQQQAAEARQANARRRARPAPATRPIPADRPDISQPHEPSASRQGLRGADDSSRPPDSSFPI